MTSRLKRYLSIVFTLALGVMLLAACGADEQDDIVLEPGDDVAQEELATEPPLVEETPLVAETPGADDAEEPQSEPPLGDDEVFGEGGIDYLDADETLLQDDAAMAQNLVTSDVFIGLDLVSGDDVHLGEVVEAYFDIDGNIHYVVLDIEEEAIVEIETIFGTDLFDEEVDTIMVSTNLLNVTADTAAGDDVGSVGLESPYRLLLLEDFGEDIPFVAQEIDAALVESDQLFLDPARFGLEDRVAQQELLQMTHFENFDLTTHDVLNLAGEDLGDIDELVVDMTAGQVAYAVIDIGGFLDLDDDNHVAIPWSQFAYETADEDFVVDVDAATLESAPTVLDEDLEDGLFEGSLANDIETYWEDQT